MSNICDVRITNSEGVSYSISQVKPDQLLEEKVEELTREVAELKDTLKVMGNAVVEFYDAWKEKNDEY